MRLVLKVALASEDHDHVTLVGSSNHFVVADGAAWLNRCDGTGFGCGDESVGEREKCIRGDNGTFEVKRHAQSGHTPLV